MEAIIRMLRKCHNEVFLSLSMQDFAADYLRSFGCDCLSREFNMVLFCFRGTAAVKLVRTTVIVPL